MRRSLWRDDGFAMLGAILIAALAALFALLALAAALASTEVATADGSLLRARAAADAALEQALHLLQWRVVPVSGSLEVTAPSEQRGGVGVAVRLEARSGAQYGRPELTDPVVRLSASARSGRATASAGAVVALCPTMVPLGLSAAEDVDVEADLFVEGCGVCAGGCVRGRELISFGAPAGVPLVPDASGAVCPPDLVHGELWQCAAVHAGGTITDAPQENDTAIDQDPADVSELVRLPGAAWLAAARAHALGAAGALSDGVLHLDHLPPAFPTGEPAAAEAAGRAAPAEGYLVVVDAGHLDGGLLLTGRRDPLWAPLTLVVIGDATIGNTSASSDPGQPGEPVLYGLGDCDLAFRGALVVTGALEVAGPASLTGHLACRRLLVRAPLAVCVPPDWRLHPPLGSAGPFLLARE